MSWRPIPMKFPATCIVCNQKLKVGEMGLWAKGLGVKHEKCSKKLDTEIEEIKIPESFLKDFDVDSSLKIIEDESEIITCQNVLIDNLQKHSSTHGTIRIGLPISDRSKGTTVDYEDFEVFWLENENFWWGFEKLDNATYPRFRNLFGNSKPKWFETDGRSRNHQVCEINPSLSGDIKVNGAFLTDGNNTFLATWRIGGEFGRGGHINEIEQIFSEKSKSYTIQSQNNSKDYFLITNLNSSEIISQISYFVKNLHQLKSRFEQIDRYYPSTGDSISLLENLETKGITKTHTQILRKFLVYESQSITDSTKLRGIKGVSKIPSDSIVSEPHYMHNLVRGVYKPEGDDYALSIQMNPQSIWGSEIINFETGEWKINYDFGDEGKYSSDITSMRKCFDSDIPIGVIYKPEKGVNKILGLGKISSNDGAKFTIIPYEIENKSSQVENLSSSYAGDEISHGDFSAQGSESTVYVRAKQGKFKEILLQEYDNKCAFCEFNEPEYLIGAHIVPYSVMRKEDPKNAMNPSDGILLCRLCDKAFEDGHLQLKENYEIIVTEKLRKSENTTVNSWLSKINSKIPIKSNSKFTPDKEFIQKKLKSI